MSQTEEPTLESISENEEQASVQSDSEPASVQSDSEPASPTPLLYDLNSPTPYPITAEQVELSQMLEYEQLKYHEYKNTGNWQLVKSICERSRETDLDNPRLVDYLENYVFDTVIEYGDVDTNDLYTGIQYINHVTGEMFAVDGQEMLHFLENFHIPYPKMSSWPFSLFKDILFRNTPQPNCNISLYVFTRDVVVCIGHDWMRRLDDEYCMIVPRYPGINMEMYV